MPSGFSEGSTDVMSHKRNPLVQVCCLVALWPCVLVNKYLGQKLLLCMNHQSLMFTELKQDTAKKVNKKSIKFKCLLYRQMYEHKLIQL